MVLLCLPMIICIYKHMCLFCDLIVKEFLIAGCCVVLVFVDSIFNEVSIASVMRCLSGDHSCAQGSSSTWQSVCHGH